MPRKGKIPLNATFNFKETREKFEQTPTLSPKNSSQDKIAHSDVTPQLTTDCPLIILKPSVPQSEKPAQPPQPREKRSLSFAFENTPPPPEITTVPPKKTLAHASKSAVGIAEKYRNSLLPKESKEELKALPLDKLEYDPKLKIELPASKEGALRLIEDFFKEPVVSNVAKNILHTIYFYSEKTDSKIEEELLLYALQKIYFEALLFPSSQERTKKRGVFFDVLLQIGSQPDFRAQTFVSKFYKRGFNEPCSEIANTKEPPAKKSSKEEISQSTSPPKKNFFQNFLEKLEKNPSSQIHLKPSSVISPKPKLPSSSVERKEFIEKFIFHNRKNIFLLLPFIFEGDIAAENPETFLRGENYFSVEVCKKALFSHLKRPLDQMLLQLSGLQQEKNWANKGVRFIELAKVFLEKLNKDPELKSLLHSLTLKIEERFKRYEKLAKLKEDGTLGLIFNRIVPPYLIMYAKNDLQKDVVSLSQILKAAAFNLEAVFPERPENPLNAPFIENKTMLRTEIEKLIN